MTRNRKIIRILVGLLALPLLWVSFELGKEFDSGAFATGSAFLATIGILAFSTRIAPSLPRQENAKLLAILWPFLGIGQLVLAIMSDRISTFAIAGGFLAIGVLQVREYWRTKTKDRFSRAES